MRQSQPGRKLVIVPQPVFILIRDKARHGIVDNVDSLPIAVPRVNPKYRLNMASLVHFSQALVSSKATLCDL